MRILSPVFALSLVILAVQPGISQNAPPNPLRPAASSTLPPAPAAEAPKTKPPKAKRARSEAQLANDQRMKACGAEWRTNKAALSAEGKTWKTYMPECRARLKASGN
jgi:hypothetical protein